MNNSFVIGIGSQRAGSTLLHKILTESTEVFMHPIKELHYFDTLFGVRNSKILKDFSRNNLSQKILEIIGSEEGRKIDKLLQCHLRASKMLSEKDVEIVDYLDLFRPCIKDNPILGEVTPEYMILPEEGVAELQRNVGENAKIILISRDPVERFISAFKLLKVYGGKKYNSTNFSRDMRVAINEMPEWMRQQDQLNDYETAKAVYSKYFDNVLMLSFEKMVESPSRLYDELTPFLEIDVDKSKLLGCFGNKVNQIGSMPDIDSDLLSELNSRYESSKCYLKEIGNL